MPSWAWNGQCHRVEDLQAAVLRHPTQSQYVKADVTHPHRLVQVKLDDGNLLYRALVAQQAPAVAARVDRKRGRINEIKPLFVCFLTMELTSDVSVL